MRRTIWTCWFSGLHDAPDLVRACIGSWERHNPGWELRCLDARSLRRFVDLADTVDLERQTLTAASLSDVLRISLLHEYGGLWVDATVWCDGPLDAWLPAHAQSGFFAFAKPGGRRALSTWLLYGEPDHPLVTGWHAATRAYWRRRRRAGEYFWSHRLFAELCRGDREARTAWARVPEVSAVGRHALQREGRLHRPAARVRAELDRSTPVFKLTHRIDTAHTAPGSMLAELLAQAPAVAAPLPVPPRARSFAELRVGSENLGDHVQLLAARRALAARGITPQLQLDRDRQLASAPGIDACPPPVGMLLGGWFKDGDDEWPPHPALDPVYAGFHLRPHQSAALLGDASIAHLAAHEPIGCRDPHTAGLLSARGVATVDSGCLSLSFPRRAADPRRQRHVYVVSRDERLRRVLPRDLRRHRFVNHYSGSTDSEANLDRAARLLAEYARSARLIVTTLLHAALPAIAMGIPVVVFWPVNDADGHRSDRERFTALTGLVPVYDLGDTGAVDWNPRPVDVAARKLALVDLLDDLSARWDAPPPEPIGPIAAPSALPAPPA